VTASITHAAVPNHGFGTAAIEVLPTSKDKLTPYLRAFQLRREVFRKPRKEALKSNLDAAL